MTVCMYTYVLLDVVTVAFVLYVCPVFVQARTIDEVQSEKEMVDSDRMWMIHEKGYTAVRVVSVPQGSRTNLAFQTNLVRHQGRDTKRVKIEGGSEILDVEEENLEKVCTYLCSYVQLGSDHCW